MDLDNSQPTTSNARPLVVAFTVERNAEGALNVLDSTLLARSESGRLHRWDPEFLETQDENIEVIDQRDEEEFIDFETPTAEALPTNSASEDEDEDEAELEELRQIFNASEDEEAVEEEAEAEEYAWTADFNMFRGQREVFSETPGPKIEGTGPMELFLQIWDQPIMDTIVEETNRYARQELEKAAEVGIGPKSRWNKWIETSVAEIYRLISVMVLMGLCVRGRVDEYWLSGVTRMPKKELMTLDRFWLMMRFLHFFNNEYSSPRDHPDRKLEKIAKLLNHLNRKFSEIYTPSQEISIDESLLLWKGHLNWVQCIRSKAARFGLKSYELCEALTGYCVKFFFYTGKGLVSPEPVLGFTSATAKIVINLMQGFLGKGYTLFMDNFYNSVKLCRFLKLHKTDVVGTLNRRRTDTPQAIKDVNERHMARGELVSRHCGDVTVLAWKDVKLVTTRSACWPRLFKARISAHLQ
ncbi:piggyBac transposable element-derived protein 4-like [Maniola jurtina]|uniref:piggyBac transposable element-derived protein 4-like n=1 Tax=Maniola jurtina TaxID=191418 RepID=UPI001E687022|nr:piggyBac transposable element-derived protein 4-like [Maniola jurtina]